MQIFTKITTLFSVILSMTVISCVKVEDFSGLNQKQSSGTNVGFNIKVTREGEEISQQRRGIMTKGDAPSVDSRQNLATMDPDIPFGLVGIDYDHHALVVDNASVNSDGSNYGTFLNSMYWDDVQSQTISFSAYYPYVHNVQYGDELQSYSIPYSVEETQAGPLVSKTVEMAVAQLNMIPLEFQHITNDIGYCICDATPTETLQGLVHLRKLTAYNVASAGVFVNDVTLSQGIWHRQGYYRTVVVFEGDAKVGVGSENEKFVGFDTLEDHMVNSHRYYSIPDEILIGKQYVEVIYDVESFEIGGFRYPPLENQVARYMLYGLLPDNVFVYGRQYTFHIGIDLSSVYREISFSASVSDWETKIYENNDEF